MEEPLVKFTITRQWGKLYVVAGDGSKCGVRGERAVSQPEDDAVQRFCSLDTLEDRTTGTQDVAAVFTKFLITTFLWPHRSGSFGYDLVEELDGIL